MFLYISRLYTDIRFHIIDRSDNRFKGTVKIEMVCIWALWCLTVGRIDLPCLLSIKLEKMHVITIEMISNVKIMSTCWTIHFFLVSNLRDKKSHLHLNCSGSIFCFLIQVNWCLSGFSSPVEPTTPDGKAGGSCGENPGRGPENNKVPRVKNQTTTNWIYR